MTSGSAASRLPFLALSTIAQHTLALTRAVGVDARFGAAPAYRSALDGVQPVEFARAACGGPSVFFHGHAHSLLFDRFLAGLDVPRVRPFSDDEIAASRTVLAAALDLLASVHPEGRAIFDLLVHALLVVRIPAFGSLSDILGIVVAGPDVDAPPLELAELLFHEAVHQALFLADAVSPLFVNVDDTARAALVHNPVLGMARRFDLAFHGTAVSVALVDLHLRAGSYVRAFELADEIAPSLAALAAAPRYLAPHGAALLDELAAAARSLAAELEELAGRGLASQGERFGKQSYLELQPSWRSRP